MKVPSPQWVTHLDDRLRDGLRQGRALPFKEVLISPKELYRFGKDSMSQIEEDLSLLSSKGMRSVFNWDLLMTQDQFAAIIKIIESLRLDRFDAIRVVDPGALRWVTENYPDLPIQLVLDWGNHNLSGLKRWARAAGTKLERVILSSQLPAQTLREYSTSLDCDIEVLGFGKLLLFSSPRKLLDPNQLNDDPDQQPWIELLADADQGFHKDFTAIQNRHGSFLFHKKYHSLLDRLDDVQQSGVQYLRLDNLVGMDEHLWTELTKYLLNPSQIFNSQIWRKQLGVDTFHCYFDSNRSDILFEKLKNNQRAIQRSGFLGEVVEVRSGSYLALRLRGRQAHLKPGSEVVIETTEGKNLPVKISQLKSLSMEPIEEASVGQTVLMNAVKGVSERSMVYLA